MLCVSCGPFSAVVGADVTQSKAIDFNQQIRPILTEHCSACHGGVKQAGGLSFVYPDQIADYVSPEDPNDSYLLERILEEDDDLRMPPPDHGPRLPKEDVALIEQWISQGAKWKLHWAYELPTRHDQPEVSDKSWCRVPIDYFVLRKLDDLGLSPSPEEMPARWLRRVTIDLVGLPPTLEEREHFLMAIAQGDREQAYREVVDRLLESPRFGERWASVWFDLVRYADSRGQGEDSHRDIWKYRDWVIDAFNCDMPYDEFTRKQIAGDLLPEPTIEDRLATAVHRLTHTNEEGGTDDEEFRVASIIDRIQTNWQTWQGTTMGCAQCHDHPYDPLSHDNFYQYMAYFNNTADCDLSDDWPNLDVPLDKDDYERASQLDRQINELRDSIWRRRWTTANREAEWEPTRIVTANTSNRTQVLVEQKADRDEYRTEGTISSNPTISTQLTIPPNVETVTGIRVNILPLDAEKALADAEVGFILSNIKLEYRGPGKAKPQAIALVSAIGDDSNPYYQIDQSFQGNKDGYGAYTRVNHPRHLVVLPEKPFDVAKGGTIVVKIRYGVFDLAAFSLVGRRGYFELSSDAALTNLLSNENLLDDQDRLAELQKQRKSIASIATPVLVERPDHLARPTHVFIRGLYLTKDKQVEPAVPAALHHGQQEISSRLELADWLVSDANPLTARVAVNRFWARMFGTGIVGTEEDFGSAGDLPSHPQLLDDLAVRFRDEYKWSVKRLLREIALSSTYRQSSRIDPEAAERDASNRMLARGPRHTLPAETVRDQMLAISGLLSDKMFGPPVHPPLPSGAWKARRGSWKTSPIGDEDRYRRTVYTYIKRSVPFPMSDSFDAPSRDFCQPRRLRSNTPLQALMLLNDTTAVECKQALAAAMAEESNELRKQIAYGFLRATCREPRSEEVDRLETLYAEVASTDGEELALESVAGVLMNLDEVLTK